MTVWDGGVCLVSLNEFVTGGGAESPAAPSAPASLVWVRTGRVVGGVWVSQR